VGGLGVEPNPAHPQGEDTAAPKENSGDGDRVDVGQGSGKLGLFAHFYSNLADTPLMGVWRGQKHIFSVS